MALVHPRCIQPPLGTFPLPKLEPMAPKIEVKEERIYDLSPKRARAAPAKAELSVLDMIK